MRYVDAGQAKLEQVEVDLNELVQGLNLERDETAVAKSQIVVVQYAPNPLPVRIDRAMIEVILSNLFSNAVKFTSQGGHIEVVMQQQGQEAWFTMSDTGIGIPPDQLERIFKRFYQVESPLRRHHEGMGLGLAIAKDLVELHNGRIWAENLAQGSKFTIALPLA